MFSSLLVSVSVYDYISSLWLFLVFYMHDVKSQIWSSEIVPFLKGLMEEGSAWAAF